MDGTRFGNLHVVSGNTGTESADIKKKNTSCPDVNDFAGYLDNKLDENDKNTVEQHMSKCPPCRNNMYEIRMLLEQQSQSAPEGLAETVKKNLQTTLESDGIGPGIKA